MGGGNNESENGNHRRVFETFREYLKLKENDRSVLKSWPKLKQVRPEWMRGDETGRGGEED